MRKIYLLILFFLILITGYFLSCKKEEVQPFSVPMRTHSLMLRDSIAQLYFEEGYKVLWIEMSPEMTGKGIGDIYVNLENFSGSQECGEGIWNHSEKNNFVYILAARLYVLSDTDTNWIHSVSISAGDLGLCTQSQVLYTN